MATIAQLAEKKQKLEAELAEVKAEIAARHGEVDEPAVAETPPSKPKRTTKKT